MTRRSPAEVFATLLKHLQSYADEVVVIGGWVHAMYLAESAIEGRPIRTDDIDLSIPPRLLAADRPTLLDLATSAGFDVDPLDEATGLLRIQAGVIDLDLLTDSEEPRTPIPIEGQPGLVVQGYPNQRLLRESSRLMVLGPDLHPSLEPPVSVRVPTLGAYVLGKTLSARTRTRPENTAKDLVYVFEILRQPVLGQQALSELPDLVRAFPEEAGDALRSLEDILRHDKVIEEAAEQLLESFRILGSRVQVVATVIARLRRLQRVLEEHVPSA